MEKKVKTKTLKQSVVLKATPHEVYEMLMDSKLHSKFTDAKAKVNRKVGGRFTAYDGEIEGTNMRLTKDKLIIQKWRTSDWPPKHYSVATFKITKQGKGSRLDFTQKDVPANKFKDISSGWKEYYWDRMKALIESS